MIRKLLLSFTLFASLGATAQNTAYDEQVRTYITSYKSLAIAEQQRSGIPAAITLAQGIHETMAGQSELATMANNHFGIKCKKEWTGETFAHDDDAPQECFRKYGKAEESYKDHSNYLKTSKRYATCFALSPTNYAGWASELRKCGYATNPQYAQRLVKIIEDYHLQDYTYAALDNRAEQSLLASAGSPVADVMMAEQAAATDKDTPKPAVSVDNTQRQWGRITVQNGVKGFWARKGEVLLEYAIQAKVRYAKLLEINALPDAPLAEDRFIYVEKGGAVSMAQEPAPVMTAQVTTVASSTASSDAYIPTARVEVATPAATIVASEPATRTEVAAAPEAMVAKPEAVTKPAEPAAMVVTEEVPQDAFSRMKAQMDKVVYAPERKTTAATPTSKTAVAPVAMLSSTAPSSTSSGSYHTVAQGETAFGISKKYGITMKQLMEWNKLDFSAIKVGQKLRVK